jgi:hypothetical protein
MALTVGTDSYISLADADTYLASRYLSTDAKLIAWALLSDANCDVLMRQALDIMEKQPYAGVKSVTTQTLEFPRCLHSDWVSPLYGYIEKYPGMYTQTDVPTDVKYAQCEIAISMLESNSRIDLQQQGVKSYTIGNLSETFAASGTSRRIPSAKAASLLRPYLAGTVGIV